MVSLARAAEFGLPPVVDHVSPFTVTGEVGLRPAPRFGVERLTGAGDHAQRRQIVCSRINLAVAGQKSRLFIMNSIMPAILPTRMCSPRCRC